MRVSFSNVSKARVQPWCTTNRSLRASRRISLDLLGIETYPQSSQQVAPQDFHTVRREERILGRQVVGKPHLQNCIDLSFLDSWPTCGWDKQGSSSKSKVPHQSLGTNETFEDPYAAMVSLAGHAWWGCLFSIGHVPVR
jgi:hypothetical protein